MFRRIVVIFAMFGLLVGVGTGPASAAPNVSQYPSVKVIEDAIEDPNLLETAAQRVTALEQFSAQIRQKYPITTPPPAVARTLSQYTTAKIRHSETGKKLLERAQKLGTGTPALEQAWAAKLRRYQSTDFRPKVYDAMGSRISEEAVADAQRSKTKSGIADIGSTVAAWAYVLGTPLLAIFVVLGYNRRAAPRSVPGAALSSLLPPESGVIVSALHLGIQRRFVQTGTFVSVSGSSATAHATGRYDSLYDFGYSVINRSQQWRRFQMKLSQLSADGHYVQNDLYSWTDLAPGESRRMMCNMDIRGARDFIYRQVTELAVGLAPPGGANEGAHFDHIVNPRRSLHELLNCDALGIWTKPKLRVHHMLLVLVGCAFVTLALLVAVAGLSSVWF